jgi:hypothetical protein
VPGQSRLQVQEWDEEWSPGILVRRIHVETEEDVEISFSFRVPCLPDERPRWFHVPVYPKEREGVLERLNAMVQGGPSEDGMPWYYVHLSHQRGHDGPCAESAGMLHFQPGVENLYMNVPARLTTAEV